MVVQDEPLMRDNMPVRRESQFIEARYWNGHSSAYGTGDQLLGLLRANWQIATIGRVTRLHRGRRFTTHIFELTRKDDMAVMIVIDNPFIQRLINHRLQESVWEEQGIRYEDDADQLEVVTMRQAVAVV
jgi:hypothetical protein